MIKKYNIKPEQAQALEDLENLIGKTIPQVGEITNRTFGVQVKGDNVEGLDLHNQGLSTLPKSIVKLTSLQTLDLGVNRFITPPELITKLKSLRILNLIGNRFSTLPEFFWRLKALTNLWLYNNPWKSEYIRIRNVPLEISVPKVLELCRQRAPITVFISYSRKDEEQYHINDITKNLKERKEIREVYRSRMQEISESHLFLFIATKNSINSEQCQHELELAVTHDIPIIPIKATEIKWEDLGKIDLGADFNLSEKLGFELEFNSELGKEKGFHDKLYDYIKKYKREINLFEPEERKVNI
jgi:hypothetical protein